MWRLSYGYDLLREFGQPYYWRMGTGARKRRRARLKHRLQPYDTEAVNTAAMKKVIERDWSQVN